MTSCFDLFLFILTLLKVCFKVVLMGTKKLKFKELFTCNTSFPTVLALVSFHLLVRVMLNNFCFYGKSFLGEGKPLSLKVGELRVLFAGFSSFFSFSSSSATKLLFLNEGLSSKILLFYRFSLKIEDMSLDLSFDLVNLSLSDLSLEFNLARSILDLPISSGRM